MNEKIRKGIDLAVFYTNARSIVNKVNKLDLEIANGSYDIIVLTETHLDSSIGDAEIFPDNYTVFRRDRNINERHGGGVLIAVLNSINVYPRDDLYCSSELMFVEIVFSNNRRTTLGVFYRPPDSNTEPLIDLRTNLDKLSTSDLVLLGDFNLPDFSWLNNTALSNSENYSILMDIIQDNFLTQLVTEPTREHNILDLVLSTSSDSMKNLSVGEKFSDHNMITFLLTGQPYVQLKSKKYVYCYKKADWLQLKLTLSQIPWNLAFLEKSIDENWNSWKDLFFAAVDECIPKTKGKKRQNAPWINKELISLCRKKLLYKKAKRSQNETTWIRYRQMNNNLNEARWRYITDLAQDLTDNNNPKPFWNFVKSKCKGTNKLISLKVGESVLIDDQGIADSINSYFSSVFTVENYDNIPVLDYIVDERLENIRCSVDEVGKLLLNLKIEKSPGPDNIPARFLKVCASELATSISLLLNKSFSMGMLPIEWKTANITPIF
jgi:hypothetical protein